MQRREHREDDIRLNFLGKGKATEGWETGRPLEPVHWESWQLGLLAGPHPLSVAGRGVGMWKVNRMQCGVVVFGSLSLSLLCQ